jgi:hypothetical protein
MRLLRSPIFARSATDGGLGEFVRDMPPIQILAPLL